MGLLLHFLKCKIHYGIKELGLIDSWYDIDSGNSTNINIIIDQDYFNIEGGTVPVAGYQPRAIVKASDAALYIPTR